MSLLSTNTMDAAEPSHKLFANKYQFKSLNSDDQKKILDGKDKVSTQRATKTYVEQFKHFLIAKNLSQVDDIPVEALDKVLYDFYSSTRAQKKDNYSVQSLKCLHSGFNRYFRKCRAIDITSDSMFVKANEMFEAVKVNAKKQGRGVKK